MTLIAAVVDTDGAVWMAGDSAGTHEGSITVRTDQKVWTHGEMVLGFAGSYRARDLLRYTMELSMPGDSENVEAYMRRGFVDAVKDAYRRGGFIGKYQQGNESQHANIIVGLRGRIFTVHGDYAVGSALGDFDVIGSGSRVAQGSLYSTRGNPNPHARLEEALDAATYFTSGVRPPYTFVRTAAEASMRAA